jgi:hypothetical protein
MTRSSLSLVWAGGMAGLLQVFVLPAAAESDGAQLLAMVDYSAVVETMAQACEQRGRSWQPPSWRRKRPGGVETAGSKRNS